MTDLKIPQGELGTKMNEKEKRRMSKINAGVRGSVEQGIGKIKKPRIEKMY